MKITPYLTFDGQARDAFTLYQNVLGGELEMMTFAQAPEAEHFPVEHRERIMHVCLKLGDFALMASDTMPGDPACGGGDYEGIKGCSISLHPESIEESERLFAALSEGGQVVMPLEKNLLGGTVRHVQRPLRRFLDDQLRVVTSGSAPNHSDRFVQLYSSEII